MPDQLLPPRFLFRFAAPCRYVKAAWEAKGVQLPEECVLPSFAGLDDAPDSGEVRVGWNEAGLIFNARVSGKKQLPWCRDNQMDESDGLHLWIDTRDTHNVHRASRFCHRFVFLPAGGGPRRDQPCVGQLAIHLAREQAKPARTDQVQIRAERRVDGYVIEAFIEAAGLTGFDPSEHPRLGFTFAILDRERGEQTFGPGSEFRYQEDPSVWGTLELVK